MKPPLNVAAIVLATSVLIPVVVVSAFAQSTGTVVTANSPRQHVTQAYAEGRLAQAAPEPAVPSADPEPSTVPATETSSDNRAFTATLFWLVAVLAAFAILALMLFRDRRPA